jgi:dienelactone hydrolase
MNFTKLLLTFSITWMVIGSASSSASAVLIRQEATPFPGSMLYAPNDGESHPGVVVLHGSEGGSLPYYRLEAEFLAAHGYAVLAFCWYNCRKNPITSPYAPLENVELRYAINAIKWLRRSQFVSGKKIALTGFSRGAEQSVILASLQDGARIIDAVAVHTPSDTIVGGFTWAASDKRCWICSSKDLACFNGSDDLDRWDWQNIEWNPSCGAPPKNPRTETIYAWLLDGVPLTLNSTIEIENFGKPVFITVGNQDEVWDHQKSVRLADRLKKHGKEVEIHIFEGEHHNFSPANENKRHELLLNFLGRVLL